METVWKHLLLEDNQVTTGYKNNISTDILDVK